MNSIWAGLDWSVLTDILLGVIPALFCITFHELSHGFFAYKLGDNTAKNAGRLTLNPIKHIDPVGLLMMAVLRFGWAKPVPVDMHQFKNPKLGMALTALAGPVSNLLLAVIVLFITGLVYLPLYTAGGAWGLLLEMLLILAYMNCALAVFNLIPLPPLDGSKILFSFLPDEQYYKLMRYERYGMIVLLLIVVTGLSTSFLTVAIGWVYEHLLPIASWSASLLA